MGVAPHSARPVKQIHVAMADSAATVNDEVRPIDLYKHGVMRYCIER